MRVVSLPHLLARMVAGRCARCTSLSKLITLSIHIIYHKYSSIQAPPPPNGQNTQPASKPLGNTDFTLASSMNFRRRSEASMRIDAAATQPEFGSLCYQLIGIVRCVIKGPCMKHSIGGWPGFAQSWSRAIRHTLFNTPSPSRPLTPWLHSPTRLAIATLLLRCRRG